MSVRITSATMQKNAKSTHYMAAIFLSWYTVLEILYYVITYFITFHPSNTFKSFITAALIVTASYISAKHVSKRSCITYSKINTTVIEVAIGYIVLTIILLLPSVAMVAAVGGIKYVTEVFSSNSVISSLSLTPIFMLVFFISARHFLLSEFKSQQRAFLNKI